MAIYTALIAMLALFNAWLAGLERREILHWCIVIYWTMVCMYWLLRSIGG